MGDGLLAGVRVLHLAYDSDWEELVTEKFEGAGATVLTQVVQLEVANSIACVQILEVLRNVHPDAIITFEQKRFGSQVRRAAKEYFAETQKRVPVCVLTGSPYAEEIEAELVARKGGSDEGSFGAVAFVEKFRHMVRTARASSS